MALADLMRAIEADADEERDRTDQEGTAEAAALVAQAKREAVALEKRLASAPETEARATADAVRARARLDAAATLRAAREQAFVSLLTGIRAELTEIRGSATYPGRFRALLAESRAALPAAHELRVDPRDHDLAVSLAADLSVVDTLHTLGGVELVSADGRTVRNTFEERLANADLLLRGRFQLWLAAREIDPASVR